MRGVAVVVLLLIVDRVVRPWQNTPLAGVATVLTAHFPALVHGILGKGGRLPCWGLLVGAEASQEIFDYFGILCSMISRVKTKSTHTHSSRH